MAYPTYRVVARGLNIAIRDADTDELIAEMPFDAAATLVAEWPKMRRFFRDLANVAKRLREHLSIDATGDQEHG